MPVDHLRARLRAFRAVDDPAGCQRFYAAHRAVLESRDMQGLTSLDPTWFDNPLVHAVLLEPLDGGQPIAGIRVHRAGGRVALPTELAYPTGPEVRDYVRQRLDTGIGEVCAAWIAPPLTGTTIILQLLTCAAFSLTTRLGVHEILASCATYTLNTAIALGMTIEPTLGDHGTFHYPTPDNLSFFVVLPDTSTLERTTPTYRDTILDLRAHPRQHRTITTDSHTIEIEIDLSLERPP